MDQNDITALLEALCERPLADGQTPSPELQAFCRQAAQALSQAGAGADAGEDTDALTAALASVLSGTDTEAARRLVEQAALRSAEVRLDAQSALAFVDAIEQSPQGAPPGLVEEILAADAATRAGSPHQGAGTSGLWSVIAGGSWSARRWWLAAACTVLLVAGATSWSVLRQQSNLAPVGGTAVPIATTSEPKAFADAPAAPRPAVATMPACEPRQTEAAKGETGAPASSAKPADQPVADCTPTADHQFADRPGEENEAVAARMRTEAARQAAAAREAEAARQAAAAEAAAKVGTAQAGHAASPTVQAERPGPMFGATSHPPAAARTPPAAAMPAAPPAAPYGAR